MKSAVVLCFIAVVSYAASIPADHYTDRYDNTNVKEILENPRLIVAYIKCILDQGKCTAEGIELKSHIKEALENYCAKCTEHQKAQTRIVIAHLINKEPGYWSELCAKFDPTNKYVHKYEEELRTIKAQ